MLKGSCCSCCLEDSSFSLLGEVGSLSLKRKYAWTASILTLTKEKHKRDSPLHLGWWMIFVSTMELQLGRSGTSWGMTVKLNKVVQVTFSGLWRCCSFAFICRTLFLIFQESMPVSAPQNVKSLIHLFSDPAVKVGDLLHFNTSKREQLLQMSTHSSGFGFRLRWRWLCDNEPLDIHLRVSLGDTSIRFGRAKLLALIAISHRVLFHTQYPPESRGSLFITPTGTDRSEGASLT